jgi:hypothetical protein
MKHITVTLKNADGKIIFKRKVTGLPLAEKAIIAKSIEFYNDPEPCMIHRSAVMNRMYFDLSSFIEEHLIRRGIAELPWDSIPERLREMIDIRADVRIVSAEDKS